MASMHRRTLLKGAFSTGMGLAITAAASHESDAETNWQRIRRTKQIRVGSANQVPYTFLDSRGTLVGQGIDVLNAALAPYGTFKLVPAVGEFGSMIPGLLANRFEVIDTGIFIRPARCQQILFGNPDSLSHDAFVVKRGNPLNVHSYADVAKNPKVRIAINRGGVEEGYAKSAGIPESQWVILPTDQDLIAAVQSGRADVAADTETILIPLLKKAGGTGIELAQPFTVPLGTNGKPAIDYGAMAFRKQDADFKKAYDVGLGKLVASAQLKSINAKWGLPADLTPDASTPTAETICMG